MAFWPLVWKFTYDIESEYYAFTLWLHVGPFHFRFDADVGSVSSDNWLMKRISLSEIEAFERTERWIEEREKNGKA